MGPDSYFSDGLAVCSCQLPASAYIHASVRGSNTPNFLTAERLDLVIDIRQVLDDLFPVVMQRFQKLFTKLVAFHFFSC
jgi:hypothetical protein